MSHPLSPDSYRHIACALPRPTAAQRARFLQYVAAAHPWAAYLPAEGGVPFTLFLNPRAGQALAREHGPAEAAQYREAFGYLEYATPVARGPSALTSADLGLPQADAYYVLDEHGCAAPLPPEFLEVATCLLNATLHPDAAQLLVTLPERVPSPFAAGAAAGPLEPIAADAELRAFAEEYTREELGGFVCSTDRAAWESRWLGEFQRLYGPRNATQRTRLEDTLDRMLAWVYDLEM
jgi:hypothetical protein